MLILKCETQINSLEFYIEHNKVMRRNKVPQIVLWLFPNRFSSVNRQVSQASKYWQPSAIYKKNIIIYSKLNDSIEN